YLLIARGSACETDSWLDLLRRQSFIDAGLEGRLHRSCVELVAMLTSKVRELSKLSPPKQLRDGDEVEWSV
ncbi:MAG: four helix bundle protein, partial [Dehalococcoidia bacterium]